MAYAVIYMHRKQPVNKFVYFFAGEDLYFDYNEGEALYPEIGEYIYNKNTTTFRTAAKKLKRALIKYHFNDLLKQVGITFALAKAIITTPLPKK